MIRIDGRRLAALLLMATGCAGGDAGGGDWAGTVRDSAGVQLVENPAQGTWTDQQAWVANEALRIGEIEAAPEYQFGQIRAVDVDDDGRIYVLDGQAQHVNVYDADGQYVSTIGKPGTGPGELSGAASGLFVHEGSVLVPDMGTQRVNVFGPDGEFERSWRVGMESGIPVRWDRDDRGRLLAQLRSFNPTQPTAETEPIVAFNDSGAVADTMATLPRGRQMEMTSTGPRIRLFDAEPLWEVTADGGLITAVNDRYRLEFHGADGALERVVSLPRQAESIGEAGKQRVKDMLRDMMLSQGAPAQNVQMMMQNVEVADRYPVFATLLEGPDGSVWVQQVRPVDEQPEAAAGGGVDDIRDLGAPAWDVLDEDGRYLGVVTLPERFQPARFMGNDLYGIWRDEMDVQYVLKLRLTRPGATDA